MTRETLMVALVAIRNARDYHAEHGKYPKGMLAADQCFDDWAADVAAYALADDAGLRDLIAAVPTGEL